MKVIKYWIARALIKCRVYVLIKNIKNKIENYVKK